MDDIFVQSPAVELAVRAGEGDLVVQLVEVASYVMAREHHLFVLRSDDELVVTTWSVA